MKSFTIRNGPAKATIAKIDKAILKRHEQEESEFRTHLGASVIGQKCDRRIWYGWRWMGREKFEARMLRLFARGHITEGRFTEFLRLIGATVWTTDDDATQFRVSFHNGHFGGSTDGVGRGGIVEIPEGVEYVTEFKSHNNRSFEKLVNDGLLSSKWEHYVQMQIYMHGLGIKVGLYMAMNKDNDDIYLEIIQYNEADALRTLERAQRIIYATEPPKRVNESPGWFECKFCPHTAICHFGAPPARNCRTCQFSEPDKASNKWRCARGRPAIHHNPQAGCNAYVQRPT